MKKTGLIHALTPFRNILILGSCLTMWGCVGVNYQDTVQPIDLTQSLQKQVNSQVLAAADEWRNSGVITRKGRRYKVSATGRWTTGPICGWTDPSGEGISNACTGSSATLIGSGNASTLLGKIGVDGAIFEIGKGTTFNAPYDGILYLRINDTPLWMGDNEGTAEVTISLARRERPPQIIDQAKQERLDNAIRLHQQAGSWPAIPEEAHKYAIRANTSIQTGDYEQAEDFYSKALELAPWWQDAHYNFALLLATDAYYSDAIDEMQQFLRLSPDSADANLAKLKINEWQASAEK